MSSTPSICIICCYFNQVTMKSVQVLRNLRDSIYFCPWNINSNTPNDFLKAPLIETFINVSNIGIICLSETFLD